MRCRSLGTLVFNLQMLTVLGNDFESWAAKNGRQYASAAERLMREQNFNAYVQRMAEVASMNPQAVYALDEFADWSAEELGGLRGFSYEEHEAMARESTPIEFSQSQVQAAQAAGAIDWVDRGAVTTPISQGRCATCQKFSATADLEGAWFLAGNPLTRLSVQEMIDCSGGDGYGMRWSIANGIASEARWPMANHTDPSITGCRGITNCTDAIGNPTMKPDGVSCLNNHDETQILSYLQHGPVSVSINAGFFGGYHGGIINCSGAGIDHAVLLVGYGIENGTAYWKLKNSWGPGFGEGGYFRFAYGNTCMRGPCQAYIGKPPIETLVV
eukprot:TRINITY_DN112573_c0_g1_i1.p1 TRINITY_DN112573_c0_g1~~TRINITY_DN112573_c0_g1_i1.p1  ORF type:complete len:349 (-),score=51.51 TRINITY_DN112573_c0_g1_i1:121-1104(-)